MLFFINSFGQLTVDDFKLSLDTFSLADKSNTIRITKAQLLKAKELHANFNWATVVSYAVYFSSGDVTMVTVDGNEFTDKLIPYFNRCGPGITITIDPVVKNKQGKSVGWSMLNIILVE